MKYKGKEIGTPSIEHIKDCLKYFNIQKDKFSPEEIFNEFTKRHWKSNGKPIRNLENCIRGICNSNAWQYFTDEYKQSKIEQNKMLRKAKFQTKLNKKAFSEKVIYSKYNEQLKNPCWKAFRKFVFAVRGCKCEMCGSIVNLQVHHPEYINGRKAWEYTCNEVVVLCEQCHRKAHGLP